MYRYDYINISYIGATNDIEKRRQEHKETNTNKIGCALKQYGYDNFEFEVLETVQFNERQELYDIEDTYMIKFDSIKNGYNTRRFYKDQL